MSANTPNYALTYPTAGDALSSVRSAMQDLATDVDTTLAALFAAGIPGAGWANVGWTSGWATVNNQGRYTKVGSRVYLDTYGIRSGSNYVSGAVLYTLPVGFRPLAAITRMAEVNSGGGLTLGLATINTNGQVVVNTSGNVAIAIGAAVLLNCDFPIN